MSGSDTSTTAIPSPLRLGRQDVRESVEREPIEVEGDALPTVLRFTVQDLVAALKLPARETTISRLDTSSDNVVR